jgi:hypothetical protein
VDLPYSHTQVQENPLDPPFKKWDSCVDHNETGVGFDKEDIYISGSEGEYTRL